MKTSNLRIISGLYKGQKLRSPENSLTHPMGAREKLALFNLLQPIFLEFSSPSRPAPSNQLTPPHRSGPTPFEQSSLTPPGQTGPTVLDLYAGSGALGIEALSRGAREVTFVEKSPKVAHLISENLSSLNPAPPKSSTAIFAESATKFCQRQDYLFYFDIIIADPPYDNFHPEDLANISQILSRTGVFVLSSPAKTNPPDLPDLQPETTRTYAAARLTVYHRQSR